MREEVGELFVMNSARRGRSSSLARKCKSRIFIQQEFNSCWVLFFMAQSNFIQILCIRRRLVTLQCCSL